MTRRTAIAIAVIFVAVLSIPLILLFLGQRAVLDQNRPAAAIQRPTIDSVGDATWFDSVETALDDRLPVRPEAVVADAWIDVEVLDDSPSDLVVTGHDKWLFITESIDQPCPGDSVGPRLMAEFEEARYITEAAGKELVVAFAPDKAAVYPEKVGFETDCVTDTAELFDQSRQIVSVLGELLDAREDELLYYQMDTHWNTLGSSFIAKGIVDALQPDLWSPESLVRSGVEEHEGDLTRMQGLPRTESGVKYRTERASATVKIEREDLEYPDGSSVSGLRAVTFTVEDVPVIEGSTLVLHDSFGWTLIHTVAPYFEDVTFIRRRDPGLSYTVPFAQMADTIIFQFVQRAAYEYFIAKPVSELFAIAFSDQAVDISPSVAVPVGGVLLSSDTAHRYAFFESTTAGVDGCELKVEGRGGIKLTRARPLAAIRIGDPVAVSTDCSDSVMYWEGSFSLSS